MAKKTKKPKLDFKSYEQQILHALDWRSEYEAMGVRFAGGGPNAGGWQECYALFREEMTPSAAVNVASSNGLLGLYTDLAGDQSKALRPWEVMARRGLASTWEEARQKLAEKAGVELPTAKPQASSLGEREAELRITPIKNEMGPRWLQRWVNSKPGITIEAASAAGAEVVGGHFGICVRLPIRDPKDLTKQIGSLLYRCDGADFPASSDGKLKARKCHVVGGYNGDKLGLIVVGTPEQFAAAARIQLCEGPTDALAVAPGLPLDRITVSASEGAKKFTAELAEPFRSKLVDATYDADKAGEAGAANACRCCLGIAAEVRNPKLPYPVSDKHGKDLRDLVNEGGFAAWLAEVEAAPPLTEVDLPAEGMKSVKENGLPTVMLPCEGSTITRTAQELVRLLATTGRFYTRDGLPMRAAYSDGEVRLEVLRAAAACSDFETVASLVRERTGKEGTFTVRAVCSVSTANQIIESQPLRSSLPKITVMSRCPVLIERDGCLVVIKGYDAESGIWAMGDDPPEMSLDEARRLLETVLADFNFASPSDKSRALAALITPAMVFGGLLAGRAAIDVGEADNSQAGKGYRNKLTAAIYRNTPQAVAQRDRGVGSLQEAFDKAIIEGACFPSLDNLRGKVELPGIESFMTEPNYYARVPYSSPVKIDTTKTIVMLTTNKAELTKDFVNRSSVARLCKHDDGYKYQKFPEGDILAHVQANQQKYLGAVFTILREWCRRGKPQLEFALHDFQAWAKSLGWIVEHLLGQAPLMAGHRDIQARIATPAQNWLRDLAMAVRDCGKLGYELRAHHLLDIGMDAQLEMPGVGSDFDHEDDKKFNTAVQAVGRKLSKLITAESVPVDSTFQIERETRQDSNYRDVRVYRFTLAEHQKPNEPAIPAKTPLCASLKNPGNPLNPAIPAIESTSYIKKQTDDDAVVHSVCAHTPLRRIAGIGGFSGDIGISHADLTPECKTVDPAIPAIDLEHSIECDHINPASWVSRGSGKYCSACNRWMGGVP